MVVEEIKGNRVKHYSDDGFKLIQNETGLLFDDAIDILPCNYTYSESVERSDLYDMSDSDAIKIIMGGTL